MRRQRAPTEAEIKQRLKEAEVIHVDETGLRVAWASEWVHVARTETLTRYEVLIAMQPN